jgi:hypothetical protein
MMTITHRLGIAGLLAFGLSSALTCAAQSTVVYASGDDLVVKSSDGKLLNFTVPAGYKFSAGDKQLTIADLKSGTKLTKPISTGTDPQPVSAVTVVKGKVFAVTPPTGVTLALASGTQEYVVPAGTSFSVDGKKLAIGDLKPGMMVEATAVTMVAPDAAPASAPPAPALVGALLLIPAAAEDLPAAGTTLPLFGFLGAASMALGLGLLKLKKRAVKA